jgi:hypothetical protein
MVDRLGLVVVSAVFGKLSRRTFLVGHRTGTANRHARFFADHPVRIEIAVAELCCLLLRRGRKAIAIRPKTAV